MDVPDIFSYILNYIGEHGVCDVVAYTVNTAHRRSQHLHFRMMKAQRDLNKLHCV
jgi:hypothetical protein